MIQRETNRPLGRMRTLTLGLLLAALLATSMVPAAKPVHADTTFTVTSTADPGNGVCDIVCTLREAITAANDTPGKDTIDFRLSNTGEVRTIIPVSPLPAITDAVTIDGYSQLGSSPNTLTKGTNATIMVELDGNNNVGNGLEIVADDVVVRGLAIGRFASNGIEIDEVAGLGDPSGVRIEGNFIGTDASGTVARPNRFNGLNLTDSGGNNTIGGTSPFQRNLVSGNGAFGVNIIAIGNAAFEVEGNLIGTKKDGTTALGNGNAGVNISGSSSGNTVGGFSPAAANTIAFNGGDGVVVFGDGSTGNRILGNSIFSNGSLGIDLRGGTESASGATANDPGDGDTGPNNLQNKPVLTSARSSSTVTTVKGRLNSTPTKTFKVQLFSNPSGGDGGKRLLGQTSVTTGPDGLATFAFKTNLRVAAGQTITATATATATATGAGSTSEFSAPRTVVAG